MWLGIYAYRALHSVETTKVNHHHLYPNLFELVKICCVIAVTTACCERVHSKLKIINGYLRARMGHARLANLVIASCERDITNKLCLDKLTSHFAIKERKLPL